VRLQCSVGCTSPSHANEFLYMKDQMQCWREIRAWVNVNLLLVVCSWWLVVSCQVLDIGWLLVVGGESGQERMGAQGGIWNAPIPYSGEALRHWQPPEASLPHSRLSHAVRAFFSVVSLNARGGSSLTSALHEELCQSFAEEFLASPRKRTHGQRDVHVDIGPFYPDRSSGHLYAGSQTSVSAMTVCLAACRRRVPSPVAALATRACVATFRPRWVPHHPNQAVRGLTCSLPREKEDRDPRLRDLGKEIADEFAHLRDTYGELPSMFPKTVSEHRPVSRYADSVS
jgi:hypothetical protein